MAATKRQQKNSLHQKLLLARSLNTGLAELAELQREAEEKRAAERRAALNLSSTARSEQEDAFSRSISLIRSVRSLPDNGKLSVQSDPILARSMNGSVRFQSMRSVRSHEDYIRYYADDPRYLSQRKALEGIGRESIQCYLLHCSQSLAFIFSSMYGHFENFHFKDSVFGVGWGFWVSGSGFVILDY